MTHFADAMHTEQPVTVEDYDFYNRWDEIEKKLAMELDPDNQDAQPYVSAMDVRWLLDKARRLWEKQGE